MGGRQVLPGGVEWGVEHPGGGGQVQGRVGWLAGGLQAVVLLAGGAQSSAGKVEREQRLESLG